MGGEVEDLFQIIGGVPEYGDLMDLMWTFSETPESQFGSLTSTLHDFEPIRTSTVPANTTVHTEPSQRLARAKKKQVSSWPISYDGVLLTTISVSYLTEPRGSPRLDSHFETSKAPADL